MAYGRLAVYEIQAIDTNESAYLFPSQGAFDMLVCNRNGGSANIRVAIVDGAVGDLADEDFTYYDYSVGAKSTEPLFVHEPASSGERIVVRCDKVDVSFRISGDIE